MRICSQNTTAQAPIIPASLLTAAVICDSIGWSATTLAAAKANAGESQTRRAAKNVASTAIRPNTPLVPAVCRKKPIMKLANTALSRLSE